MGACGSDGLRGPGGVGNSAASVAAGCLLAPAWFWRTSVGIIVPQTPTGAQSPKTDVGDTKNTEESSDGDGRWGFEN